MLEEYKQLYSAIANYQLAYSKLETLAIGGCFAAYGFLAINIDKIPSFAWWAVPGLVAVAAIRCTAYYFLINFKIAPHLSEIERKLYPKDFKGHQTSHSEKWPGRKTNMFFNLSTWLALFVLTVVVATWRQFVWVPAVGLGPG